MLEYVEIVKFSTYVPIHLYDTIQSEDTEQEFSKRRRSTLSFIDYLIREEAQEVVADAVEFESRFGKIMGPIADSIHRQLAEVAEISGHRIH